jgi:phosphoesterase RecJ-like protein
MLELYDLHVERAEKILVTTHAFVDPDALGSLMALVYVLQQQGKDVTPLVFGDVLPEFNFLLGDTKLINTLEEPIESFDLIIVLDCGDLKLSNRPELDGVAAPLVNIDHHPTNPRYGTYCIVEPEASSTAEILYKIFVANDWHIDAPQATNLLAGIMGDTGSFQHSNTTADTLAIAGRLLACGADLGAIVQNFFTRTSHQIRALSLALENAYFDKENKVIISGVTAEDREAGDFGDGAFPGAIDLLNTCSEATYAAFFKQKGSDVTVSLRSEESKNFNVAELAEKFGGGGHVLAAGFRIKGVLERGKQGFLVRREIRD